MYLCVYNTPCIQVSIFPLRWQLILSRVRRLNWITMSINREANCPAGIYEDLGPLVRAGMSLRSWGKSRRNYSERRFPKLRCWRRKTTSKQKIYMLSSLPIAISVIRRLQRRGGVETRVWKVYPGNVSMVISGERGKRKHTYTRLNIHRYRHTLT